MKVLDLLNKQNKKLTDYGRMLDRIQAGNYYMSIQASNTHYCSPRETFKDLHSYYEVELAIFSLDENWVFVNEDPLFNKFERYNELISKADSLEGSTQVFGYVPVDLIEELYQFLITN